MQLTFQGIEIKPGMRIKVLTTLSHHKEVVELLVEEIHTDLNSHPLCNDPTGSGNIQGTRDSVAFYQSQVVGVVSF